MSWHTLREPGSVRTSGSAVAAFGVTVPLGGEHFRRRPFTHVQAAGLQVERRDRFKAGIVERLAARKPLGSTKDTTPRGAGHAQSPEPGSSNRR